MKEFKVLKFIDKFQSVFEKLGADYKMMRKILQIKLTMDERRVPTVFNNNRKKKEQKQDSNSFFKSLWMYVLMGLMIIPFLIMKSNYIFQMGIAFGIIMFLVMSTLISDFSTVLLDVRDKNIIGTKPVSAQTLSLAKGMHIAIYISYITIALVGPALVASLIAQGIVFTLLFIISIVLLEMFIIVLTALLYFLIIRFFDGEKLKDIINYFQIGLSIGITVAYQLIGRLFSIVDLEIYFVPKWWQYFIPPIWFAAPFQMLKKSEVNSYFIIFTILAVVVPCISFVIYIKLTPVFEKNLQKLNNNSDKSKKSKKVFTESIGKLICRSKEERTFFRFTANMIKNEREFKLKVYPMLGFSIVFPFIFIFQQLQSSSLYDIGQGRTYLFIYFCALMLPNVIYMLSYSGKYKGAWIYKAAPIKEYTSIFKGSLKAVTVGLVCPVYFIVTVIFIFIYGVRIIPDLILVFLITLIFALLSFLINKKKLPFSESFTVTQSGNPALIVFSLFFLPLMAGIHFALTFVSFGVYAFMIIAFIVNIILWKFALNASIKNAEIVSSKQ